MRAENINIPSIPPVRTDDTPEELSDYDRKLLAAVVATNKELIIQSKRQSIQLHKVVMKGTERFTDFLSLGLTCAAALFLYNNLPSETKAVIAEKYLTEGIGVIAAIGAGHQLLSNKKARQDLNEFEQQQKDEISFIDREYK